MLPTPTVHPGSVGRNRVTILPANKGNTSSHHVTIRTKLIRKQRRLEITISCALVVNPRPVALVTWLIPSDQVACWQSKYGDVLQVVPNHLDTNILVWPKGFSLGLNPHDCSRYQNARPFTSIFFFPTHRILGSFPRLTRSARPSNTISSTITSGHPSSH